PPRPTLFPYTTLFRSRAPPVVSWSTGGAPMRRFTILGLMGLVLGMAVAIAALRNADDYWAGGLMLGTALLIGVVSLGAYYDSGRDRKSTRLNSSHRTI